MQCTFADGVSLCLIECSTSPGNRRSAGAPPKFCDFPQASLGGLVHLASILGVYASEAVDPAQPVAECDARSPKQRNT
jgi:hypothetical protein